MVGGGSIRAQLMPRLLLLRHAKSSWDDHRLADIDRPLAPRGHRAARLIAEAIGERGFRPDRVLCSPAVRTRETLAALVSHLGDKDIEIEIADGLYEPHSGEYRAVIADHGDAAKTLLVIGHNPAIQATTVLLADGKDPATAGEIGAKFPTAALAVLDFTEPDWSRLKPHSGKLVAFLTPKMLAKGTTEHDADD
jgi:phosphohistidine phosphatase